MSSEKLKTLTKAYPLFFRGEAFEFECQDGWFAILDALCQVVEGYLQNASSEYSCYPVQIKEKFGGLRVYIDGDAPTIDAMYGAIDLAAALSCKTCEVCGQAGEIRKSGHQLQARCTVHAGVKTP